MTGSRVGALLPRPGCAAHHRPHAQHCAHCTKAHKFSFLCCIGHIGTKTQAGFFMVQRALHRA